MTHSPLPELKTFGSFQARTDLKVCKISGLRVVVKYTDDFGCDWGIEEGQAEYVCKAVNAHDDLVDAATIGLHYAARAGGIHDAAVIKAALAKAGA